eukprot:gene51542-68967_t
MELVFKIIGLMTILTISVGTNKIRGNVIKKESVKQDLVQQIGNASTNQLQPATRTMQDLKIILDLLQGNVPFGYSHFNDGEIMSIKDCPEGNETDWGWQVCSGELSKAMLGAI